MGSSNKGNSGLLAFNSNKGNFFVLWVGTRPQGAASLGGAHPGCNRITPQYDAMHFTTNLQQMGAAPQDIL